MLIEPRGSVNQLLLRRSFLGIVQFGSSVQLMVDVELPAHGGFDFTALPTLAGMRGK